MRRLGLRVRAASQDTGDLVVEELLFLLQPGRAGAEQVRPRGPGEVRLAQTLWTMRRIWHSVSGLSCCPSGRRTSRRRLPRPPVVGAAPTSPPQGQRLGKDGGLARWTAAVHSSNSGSHESWLQARVGISWACRWGPPEKSTCRTWRGRGAFKAWIDHSLVETVRIALAGGIAWGTDIELCRDALYMRLTGKSAGDVMPGHAHRQLAPELRRFYGIVVRMYFDDHAPGARPWPRRSVRGPRCLR